jgi:hypothetical protein
MTILETEKVESILLPELVEALNNLEKEGKLVDIEVYPKCMSPQIRRVKSMSEICSFIWAITPPEYDVVNVAGEEKIF